MKETIAPRNSGAAAPQPWAVAVADDEPEILDYLARVLTYLGCRVVARAGDGQELVTQCRMTHPDLIVTDIRMPVMSGVQAVVELTRERPALIIFVSAQQPGVIDHGLPQEFVVDYLVKPIRRADLAAALANAVQRRSELQGKRTTAVA